MPANQQIRNIAIIAHVDHGKTTLVDELLRQSGTLDTRGGAPERVMDSNDLERERGITILSKNTAIAWRHDDVVYRINILDTPGHADFGGEVERILSMVDSVVLLVDAVDGPMPQTRFVTRKAFERGLNPLVVVNKVDRDGARPVWVVDRVFDLFDDLGATEAQLDFPVVYASALRGYASTDPSVRCGDVVPLLEAVVRHTPPPPVAHRGPFQMQVSTLDYSSYVGVIGIGRIRRGSITPNTAVTVVGKDGSRRGSRVLQVLGFNGLERIDVDRAGAGDIVAVTGVDELAISDTLCAPDRVEALPALTVDEPTITMTFRVNNSPFAGREGRFLTSRQLRDRLMREASHNVALRVADTDDPERFRVSGRGELHLAILIETMRREGYELALSRPEAIVRDIDGAPCEPWEVLVVDIEDRHQGAVIDRLNQRRGELQDMAPDGRGRLRLDFLIPARGLIGFQTEFRTMTAGSGIMHHVFDHYGPCRPGRIGARGSGALIANSTGTAVAYALFNLQDRGRLFIGPGDKVYEGQIIGEHARANDLTVNPLKGKQLSNVRAAGKDDNVLLTPPVRFSLEQALEFLDDDELMEVTPAAVRLRKEHLTEGRRRQAGRAQAQ